MGIEIKMWKDYSPSQTSADFLANDIHQRIYQQYFAEENKAAINADIEQAKTLTQFFSVLKNYDKAADYISKQDLESNLTVGLFYKLLGDILTTYGLDIKKLFRNEEPSKNDRPIVFEKEISAIIETFQRLNKSGSNIDKASQVDIKPIINIGGRTNMNLGYVEDAIKWACTQTASDQSVRSMRTLHGKKTNQMVSTRYDLGNGRFQKGSVFTSSGKDLKIDVMNTEVLADISEEKGFSPWLTEVAKALSQATFSAKNYKQVLNSKAKFNLVKTGDTNIISVLYQFLPSYFNDPKKFQAFIMAILSRYFLDQRGKYRLPNPTSTDPQAEQIDTIGLHFFHIQTIYQLSGAGQYAKDSDLQKYQNLINQGAKFLIVNDHEDNLIRVFSIKELLMKEYRENFEDLGRRVDYHRSGTQFITRYTRVANFH